MIVKLKNILLSVYRNLRLFLQGITFYYNDFEYFRKYSNLGTKDNTEPSLRASLIANYHIIEKGLSMPNRRLGFGRDRLLLLIKYCKTYFNNYGNHPQLEYAVSIIKEYDILHKSSNYKLDDELQRQIDGLLSVFPLAVPAKQLTLSNVDYFDKVKESFDLFSASRHSMRHFHGTIPLDQIEKAINLSKNAPSACNKQPVRVYVVSEKDKIAEILELQQGNRGFGQDIDVVIVVTTQLTGCSVYTERYMPYMDAGIFTMNLLYSLHFYKIGAIPLVWLSSKKRDNKLREIVDIPTFEIPAIIVGAGKVSENVVCAISPRLKTEEIMHK